MFTRFVLIVALLNRVILDVVDASSAACMNGPPGPRPNVPVTDHWSASANSSTFADGGRWGQTSVKHCVFRNVCWHRYGLLFRLTQHGDGRDRERSWVYGSWPITNLSASTADHNGLPIDVIPLVDDTFDRVVDSSRQLIRLGRAILLRRYLPNNLMHVIHDDILPAFALREQLNNASYRSSHSGDSDAVYVEGSRNGRDPAVSLLLVDGERHQFDELYSMVGASVVYSKRGQVTCVDELFVGLPRTTQWYQYGFRMPQGPLNGTDASILERFRERAGVPTMYNGSVTKSNESYSPHRADVFKTAASTPSMQSTRSKCTLLIREYNRKILNINEIEETLRSERNCLVHVVSLDRYSLSELRRFVGLTDLLVAMHGAELALAIFLPRASAVLEMFPYAVPSNNYTPYRTLCRLLDIAYEAWENPIRENSFGDVSRGLAKLSDNEKARILRQDKVEPHLCCDDPAWLYRIYQDSWVDIISFQKSLMLLVRRKWTLLQCSRPTIAAVLTSGSAQRGDSEDLLIRPSSTYGDWRAFWEHLTAVADGEAAIFYLSPVRDPVCGRHEDRVSVRWKVPFNSVVEARIQYEFSSLNGVDQTSAPFPSKVDESVLTKIASAGSEQTQQGFSSEGRSTDVWYEVLTQCGSNISTTGVVLTRTQRTSVEIHCRDTLFVWIKPENGTELANPLIC